jgi:hypothetical protein
MWQQFAEQEHPTCVPKEDSVANYGVLGYSGGDEKMHRIQAIQAGNPGGSWTEVG